MKILKQSYVGFVKQHLDEIEQAIEYGIPHEMIRQELENKGFTATLSSFKSALLRARKWRKLKQEPVSKGNSSVAPMFRINTDCVRDLSQAHPSSLSRTPNGLPTDEDISNLFKPRSIFPASHTGVLNDES